MSTHPIPENESDRLHFLRNLRLDFSAPIPELQKLAEVASVLADTPIALVSLVDAEAQTFAANVGLPGVEGTSRDVAFCAHAIMGSDQLVVSDAEADPRFRDNPLVTGAPDIRSYVGSVLEPEDGVRLGTLCVIDTKARDFSSDVLAQLDRLSDAATALLLAYRDRLALRERLALKEGQQAVLRKKADCDPLTGLLNQAGFRERVEAKLAKARGPETLAIVDVDHFKQVNDRWGHPFGDRYLQTIAEGLSKNLGADAVVGRIGGDEFAALLPAESPEAQTTAIDRARTWIRGAAVDLGKPELGRLSIGLCSFAQVPERSFEALYQRADIALYATKERGRNATTRFSKDLDAHFNLRALRARFAEALTMGEVRPYFQPKVRLCDGRVAGFELLARWHDPRRGLLMPAQFHKVLTDPSVGPELTRRMIAGAIEALVEASKRGMPPVRMAINVTHHDLGDATFVEETDWRLRGAGLDWRYLAFEVTEKAILNDTQSEVRRRLEEIRERGSEVALDDFGTGHAGLLHLRDWPIDVLKLDATFVKGIVENDRDRAIVHSMVDLAHRLDLKVVAEGIEVASVARQLHDMGCAEGQGFLFSAAVDDPMELCTREFAGCGEPARAALHKE
jgi:diguanylate cyclase (GGDEF)-like protein